MTYLAASTIRRCLFAAVLSGSVGVSVRAGAQSERNVSIPPPAAKQADPLQKARAALRAGRWAQAEASFEAALAAPEAEPMTAAQRAEVLGQLGLSELEQRKYRDAAEHLARSLEQEATLPRALLKKLTRAFDKAVQHVAEVYVAVTPPDATILLDGASLGTGAVAHVLFVDPGIHTLRAHLAGHEDAHQVIEVEARQKAMVVMRLSPTVTRAPAPPKVSRPPVKPKPPVREPGPWASWPGALRVAGIAVTTATVATGALFLLRANVLDRDIQERIAGLNQHRLWYAGACREAPQRPACAELDRLQNERNGSGLAGTGLVVAGGVVGAVTAASFFTDFSFLRPNGEEGVKVVPVATGQQAGLFALGVW